jgi:hypothetical protein
MRWQGTHVQPIRVRVRVRMRPCAPTSSSGHPPHPWSPPRAGLLFGRESSGLTNEEVARATKVIAVVTGQFCDVRVVASAASHSEGRTVRAPCCSLPRAARRRRRCSQLRPTRTTPCSTWRR